MLRLRRGARRRCGGNVLGKLLSLHATAAAGKAAAFAAARLPPLDGRDRDGNAAAAVAGNEAGVAVAAAVMGICGF